MLEELDKELESRGLEFCRFADDCNIFIKTPKAVERVMAGISRFIGQRLKLKINTDKSQVEWVNFHEQTQVNSCER